jgi:hypothetical protein
MITLLKRIFHIHKWTNWGSSFAFGYRSYQRRRCIKCGLGQEQVIGWATKEEIDAQYD